MSPLPISYKMHKIMKLIVLSEAKLRSVLGSACKEQFEHRTARLWEDGTNTLGVGTRQPCLV